MNAALGVGLLATCAIVFAWSYGQFRRPNPARWTESETLTMSIVALIVGLLAIGLGFIGRFAFNVGAETAWVTDIVTIAVAVPLTWFLVPLLMKPGRPAVAKPTSAAGPAVPLEVPPPANDPGPSLKPSGRPAGGRAKRRAA